MTLPAERLSFVLGVLGEQDATRISEGELNIEFYLTEKGEMNKIKKVLNEYNVTLSTSWKWKKPFTIRLSIGFDNVDLQEVKEMANVLGYISAKNFL